jgi:uncharacterized protein (DUF433 family)
MNKYQRKINKITRKQISEKIKETEQVLHGNPIQTRQNGKTTLQIIQMYKLLSRLQILNSNRYYRFIRKSIRIDNKTLKLRSKIL